jgi:hypothetical protein
MSSVDSIRVKLRAAHKETPADLLKEFKSLSTDRESRVCNKYKLAAMILNTTNNETLEILKIEPSLRQYILYFAANDRNATTCAINKKELDTLYILTAATKTSYDLANALLDGHMNADKVADELLKEKGKLKNFNSDRLNTLSTLLSAFEDSIRDRVILGRDADKYINDVRQAIIRKSNSDAADANESRVRTDRDIAHNIWYETPANAILSLICQAE